MSRPGSQEDERRSGYRTLDDRAQRILSQGIGGEVLMLADGTANEPLADGGVVEDGGERGLVISPAAMVRAIRYQHLDAGRQRPPTAA